MWFRTLKDGDSESVDVSHRGHAYAFAVWISLGGVLDTVVWIWMQRRTFAEIFLTDASLETKSRVGPITQRTRQEDGPNRSEHWEDLVAEEMEWERQLSEDMHQLNKDEKQHGMVMDLAGNL